MHTRAEKTRSGPSNRPSQTAGGPAATFQLVDNRPEAFQLRKLQETLDNSPRQTSRPQQLKAETEPVQRQGDLEEEELLQGKFEAVQRQNMEEEELLQGKFETVQRQEMDEEELMQGRFGNSQAPAQRQGAGGGAENRTGMPDALKSGLESLSGLDMSGVRVHYNSARPAELDAHAYAQGQDIHLAPGQDKHLPHEAWHTVQQMQGRVRPTMQAHGVSINDDPGLEKEADVMGASALASGTQRKRVSED